MYAKDYQRLFKIINDVPNKNELKVQGKQVLYWNGLKWLVKEFCDTPKKAKDKEKELNSYAK